MKANSTETSTWNKRGKVFFMVSIILFIMIGYVTLENENSFDRGGIIWLLLIMIFSNIVLVIQNYRKKELYYTLGSILICVAGILFFFIPEIMWLVKVL